MKKENFFSWKISENKLKEQLDGYYTLGITKTYRGISILITIILLVLGLGVSLLIPEYLSIIGVLFSFLIYIPILFFVYRGHRWAIILLMILYTYEQGTMLITEGKIIAIFWWLIIMSCFYKTLLIENERLKQKIVVSQNENFCGSCGNKIEKNVKFCTSCGKKIEQHSLNNNKKMSYILGTIFSIVIILLGLNYYHPNYLNDDVYISNILLELEPSIQPVGYFDDPNLFDSETITNEEWFSHLVYYEFEKTNSNFNNSRTQFPNQKEVFSSIVKIVCEDEEYFYYGSGTNLDGSGLVLTNQHVVEGMDEDSCVVGFPNPESGLVEEAYWATPIFDEENMTEHDLAYLSIEEPVFDEDNNIYGYYERLLESSFPTFEPPNKCSESATQLGDEVFIIGYPPLSGGGLTITSGLISSLYSPSGYLITSAKIVSGNSGGSAIDKEGCFVGVPTAIYYEEESEYLGEIIDSEFVVEFMNAVSDDYNDYINSL